MDHFLPRRRRLRYPYAPLDSPVSQIPWNGNSLWLSAQANVSFLNPSSRCSAKARISTNVAKNARSLRGTLFSAAASACAMYFHRKKLLECFRVGLGSPG